MWLLGSLPAPHAELSRQLMDKDAPPSADARLSLPARLAIYYGYPSLVNGAAGDLRQAAAVFSRYDVVVFGDGLELVEPRNGRGVEGRGRTEHESTQDIIRMVRESGARTAFYGYVDLGSSQHLTVPELQRRTGLWAAMGVKGIFVDEAGYDFGVTRARQNDIVQHIHALGLAAFLNAYNPDDLFSDAKVPLTTAGGGNPDGVHSLLGRGDLFLLESFQIVNGRYEDPLKWINRTRRAASYRSASHTSVFAVTTSASPEPFTAAQLQYAWWSALLWDMDGFGWGEPDFSSHDSVLPWRARPSERGDELGTRWMSPVLTEASRCSRRTDKGTILIDTQAHTARFEPRPLP
jgi:hypothetical protein